MEHALDILGTHRSSLSAGSLPGRDRASLLDRHEEMSKRSPRPRFDGRNAQLQESALEGFVDAGRRMREAAAIAPVIAVSSSGFAGRAFADRACELVAGLDPLARAA